jgi:hypothetical protein
VPYHLADRLFELVSREFWHFELKSILIDSKHLWKKYAISGRMRKYLASLNMINNLLIDG